MSWNKFLCTKFLDSSKSSSSWGCELKYHRRWNACWTLRHPLREDVSWNISTFPNGMTDCKSSSSWGCELKLLIAHLWWQMVGRHPLREDVSWNDAENAKGGESISHPLREDVSWNLEEYGVNHRCSNMVLLVRRWIEISLIFFLSFARRSHYYTLFNLNIKLNYRNLRGNFYMCS